jgi:DNA replication protein DnaC
MLIHPTREKLQALKLIGMLKALDEQNSHPEIQTLSFEERLGLLVDRELLDRDNRRLKTRLRAARLRQSATLEDVDYHHPRGLDRALLTELGTCRWVREHLNILVCGPTGVGKTWLACALAHQAWPVRATVPSTAGCCDSCRISRSHVLTDAMASGSRELAKTDVLVLDDWGLAKLTDEQRRDLLEILDDRHGRGSTLITSQFPVDRWHELIGAPTLADAILDRLVHNAYRLNLTGDSRRKKRAILTPTDDMQ